MQHLDPYHVVSPEAPWGRTERMHSLQGSICTIAPLQVTVILLYRPRLCASKANRVRRCHKRKWPARLQARHLSKYGISSSTWLIDRFGLKTYGQTTLHQKSCQTVRDSKVSNDQVMEICLDIGGFFSVQDTKRSRCRRQIIASLEHAGAIFMLIPIYIYIYCVLFLFPLLHCSQSSITDDALVYVRWPTSQSAEWWVCEKYSQLREGSCSVDRAGAVANTVVGRGTWGTEWLQQFVNIFQSHRSHRETRKHFYNC